MPSQTKTPGKRKAAKSPTKEGLDAQVKCLWKAHPELYRCLREAGTLEAARDAAYACLERTERAVFVLNTKIHILEKATVRECIRALKSIFGPINEKRTNSSALDSLWKLARGKQVLELSEAFIMEFIHLFQGVAGNSGVYKKGDQTAEFLKLKGRKAAEARTKRLDEIGRTIKERFSRYPSGLEPKEMKWRDKNRKRILDYFGGKESDWSDYQWHLRNVIREADPLLDLIELTPEHQEAVRKCADGGVPFGITPYYLSLMHRQLTGGDSAVRAQVIPPPDYVEMLLTASDQRGSAFDFMGEQDCSPVDLVTRRYPGIAILKPFNTCAQICVYCQRNWEIDQVLDPKAAAAPAKVKAALDWFDEHPGIAEVLITGGDPCVMRDGPLRKIIEDLAGKKHIQRIRIGTRTPVVLPMRWTDELMAMLSEFHVPGRREIAICTHFEHSAEITPEARDAVAKIRRAGMGVYNQTVFTFENSRRFETAKLRRDLRLIGVDPYYTFNMKGKEETKKYMVPIARLLQERKEEARLFPGLDRTDEPVFNVPRLGKNHLRAWQDHRVIMVLPNGSRVYEFHPWEKNIDPIPPYNYIDVPLHDYLQELKARGEDPEDYRTIWYYY